jgi:hypothetical protein
MRIVDPRKTVVNGRARVAATSIWEDNDRAPTEICLETRGAGVGAIQPNPDAFLLACAIPAMEYGERRVSVEGAVCAELRNGLQTSFITIRHWFPELSEPTLEATEGFRAAVPPAAPRVAAFWSGRINSLATIRSNRIDYPLDHPASIRDGLFVFGLDPGDFAAGQPVADRLARFDRSLIGFEGLARETGVELVRVSTNLRAAFEDDRSWVLRGAGAGLAAVAHAFSSRFSRALLPSTGLTESWPPAGAHPLLDPNYSSAALEIRHDGYGQSLLSKTAMVADWAAGMAVLECCDRSEAAPGQNCGRCAQCVRTMIHLAALGKLEDTRLFPVNRVTKRSIRGAPISSAAEARLLEPTADLFAARGQPGLARAVRRRLARHRALERVEQWRTAGRRWMRRS